MDFFFNVILPIWIIGGSVGLFISGFNLYFEIDQYRLAKKASYPNKKSIASRANRVIRALLYVLAVLLLPITIVPSILYFPFVWVRNAFKFFRQVFTDRKGS